MNTIPTGQIRAILEKSDIQTMGIDGIRRLGAEQPGIMAILQGFVLDGMLPNLGPQAADKALHIVGMVYLVLDEAQKGTGLVPASFANFLSSAEFDQATGDLP